MMQFWNELVHTALLGSDKKAIDPSTLPPKLGEIAGQIQSQTTDKEEQFLRFAAIAFNYRQAGAAALTKEGLTLPLAETEERPYCSPEAMWALNAILEENNPLLLRTWLFLCHSKGQLIQPDALPDMLTIAGKEKLLRDDILSVSGKRAAWLGWLNPEWHFENADSEEERWQTGSAEQRRAVLQQLRQTDPEKGRLWLEQTWTKEDAATKLDFLQQLETGLSEKDLPFLQSLSTEKGKKIKEEVNSLLKKIPSSPLVLDYWKALSGMLTVGSERQLPSLKRKNILELSPADPALIKALPGIEPLSNRKEFSDDEFIAWQLMQWIPVSFYTQHWKETPPDIIRLFEEDEIGKKLFSALILSVVNFSDNEMAAAFMDNAAVFYLDLIPLLPVEIQERQTIKFFQQSPDKLIQYAAQRKGEWSPELTALILQQAVKFPYQYTKAFFAKIIHRIPVSSQAFLNTLDAAESLHTNYWRATREEVSRLLRLKQQIITAFTK